MSARGRPFVEGEAKLVHEARECIRAEDGSELLRLKPAASFARRSTATILRWRDKGLIQPQEGRTAYNRLVEYYPKAKLQEIAEADAARPAKPKHDDLVYIGDFCRELGWSVRTLRRRMADHI